MQACGPVVRPHEILQTLIISIPQPSAAVKSFFELSRNFGAPEAMSALLLYRQQTADLPPIQRLAAGGEIYARSERAQWPPSAAEMPGPRQGTKGARTPNGFLAPLDTPNLPLAELACGDSSKCEGPPDAFGALRSHA